VAATQDHDSACGAGTTALQPFAAKSTAVCRIRSGQTTRGIGAASGECRTGSNQFGPNFGGIGMMGGSVYMPCTFGFLLVVRHEIQT